MKFCHKIIFSFLFFSFFSNIFFAADIGSDTAVTRYNSQQTVNDGDRIAGFASLQGGFKFFDSSVTGTFDSFFPVSGEVDLDGGTLILDRDLVFNDGASIKQLGNITGQNHCIKLAPSITQIPLVPSVTAIILYDVHLILDGNVIFNGAHIIFGGTSIIDGQGFTLSLGPSFTLGVATDSDLVFRDLEIRGINGNKIQCTDSLSTISFEDVEWVQDGNFTFTVGKFDVLDDFILEGDGYSFGYETDQVSTVSTYGKIFLDNGFTFHYDPPIVSHVLFDLYAETSELILNGATLHSTSTGLILETGRLIVDRSSVVSGEGTVDAEAIILASSLDIQQLPAAVLQVEGNVIIE